MNINISSENIFEGREIDEKKAISVAKQVLKYYMAQVGGQSALAGQKYDTVSFDIFYCSSEKTHELNLEYRGKDYPADIITFAVFADSPDEERFVLDMEINLGEIIIGLDKIIEEAQKKEISKEAELLFLISHGIMHLLGFDHQSEEEFNFVVKYQKQALESMGIKYDKI